MTPSDDELIRLMASGVEEAFATLYHRYQGRVFRFALLMSGCPATADDVTQEVFLSLLRDACQYDSSRGALLAYLYGIARKQVLRVLKRNRPFTQLGDEADEDRPEPTRHLISQADPLNELARNEVAGAVRQAVLALPARYREVVVMCDFQEMSYAEAADALDCSVGTISSRLNRARAARSTAARWRNGAPCFARHWQEEVLGMKCQEFEPIIINMARGQLIEALARETTLAHLDRCARCASAFEVQQALSAGIRVAAESLANRDASARVEEALRIAFRERARQFTAPEIRPRWPRWTVGAAAAILLLALLAGVNWLKSPPADQKQEATNLPATPSGAAPGQKQNSQMRIERGRDQNQKTARNSANSRRLSARSSIRRVAAPDAEVATSFYSLVEEGEIVPLESGRVVRVEVSVSALLTLGLPITADSMDRTVQADLLVGQDGLARAIRFLP